MRVKKVPQESNAEAALIILDNPDRYGGLPMIWAKAWLSRHGLVTQLVRKSRRMQDAARVTAGEIEEFSLK